jgi:hypothetical protein
LWRQTLPGVTDWIFDNLVNSAWSQSIRNEPLAAGALLLAGGLALLSIPLTGGASLPFVAALSFDGLVSAGTYTAGTALYNFAVGKSDPLEGVTFGRLVANALLGAALNQAVTGIGGMPVYPGQELGRDMMRIMSAFIISAPLVALSDDDPNDGEMTIGTGLVTLASFVGKYAVFAAIGVNAIIAALDTVDFSQPSKGGSAGFG